MKNRKYLSLFFISIFCFSAFIHAPFSFADSEQKSEDGRYIDHGDGTITDTTSGLMWTKKDSYSDLEKCLKWDAAKKYASEIKTGGYSDWRMPTLMELKTICEVPKVNNMGAKYKNWRTTHPLHLDPIFADFTAFWSWSSKEQTKCCAFSYRFTNCYYHRNPKSQCGGKGVRPVRLGR